MPTRTPYANNPNSYINNLRDNGFVSHYDTRRRRGSSVSPQPVAAPAQPQTQRETAVADNVLPLASFFDASLTLVWPNEAPAGGELKEKRDASDEASRAVLEEIKRQALASVSSAAHARKKLLGYGQPALQEIRANATPAIADAFHLFLLSLYDSLAQAAAPPQAAIPPAPPPR